MKLSNLISSFHSSNSSDYFSTNGTKEETDFEMLLALYVVGILFGLPINSYVIWLIVRGTGNGLAAEIFILNLSVCEIVLSFESLLISLAYKCEILWMLVAFVDGLLVLGRPLFQCLLCVERYLAVVHPVTFLKFKHLFYRLMCCAVAWLAIFAAGGLSLMIWLFFDDIGLQVTFIALPFLILLSIQLFSCVAVLRALKQSGPGERGREREEENNIKKRAFYFILITTVTTVITYTPYTIIIFLSDTAHDDEYLCFASFTYTLAGLVEPVLFLYRVGKLNFIKCQ